MTNEQLIAKMRQLAKKGIRRPKPVKGPTSNQLREHAANNAVLFQHN